MRSVMLMSVVLLSGLAWADEAADTVAAGKAVYSQTCVACHGPNGKGAIPGVADLTASDGALTKSDEELVKSIAEGVQSPGSPLAMPANGGNPSLTEADIKAVIAYLRANFGG